MIQRNHKYDTIDSNVPIGSFYRDLAYAEMRHVDHNLNRKKIRITSMRTTNTHTQNTVVSSGSTLDKVGLPEKNCCLPSQ